MASVQFSMISTDKGFPATPVFFVAPPRHNAGRFVAAWSSQLSGTCEISSQTSADAENDLMTLVRMWLGMFLTLLPYLINGLLNEIK